MLYTQHFGRCTLRPSEGDFVVPEIGMKFPEFKKRTHLKKADVYIDLNVMYIINITNKGWYAIKPTNQPTNLYTSRTSIFN